MMLDPMINAVLGHIRERRDRRLLRGHLLHDDALLRDIGLTRTDVEIALSTPMRVCAKDEAYRLSDLTLRLDAFR